MEDAPTEDDEPASGGDAPASGGDPPAEARTIAEWFAGGRIPRQTALLVGLVLPAMLLAYNMWRVRPFTIDDSYISYRYARNFARGLGLVYNAGERIEGYTNFLWTVILAGGIKLGIDPDNFAKGLGSLSAFGALGLTYAISGRVAPYRTLPCTATWLLASTVVFSGWPVFGLETSFFLALVLGGTLLFLREEHATVRPGEPAPAGERPGGFPWSGVVFGLAGITRPEAPMFLGILMVFLGRRFFARQNLLRGALFAAPVLAHLAFRRSYYGAWVPNTALAKTGNVTGQLQVGMNYIQNYAIHAGPVLWLALIGLSLGLVHRRRDLLAMAAIGVAVLGYVILVGGDWMPLFRFMSPFEPFCFLLVDVGVRHVVDRRRAVPNLALAIFTVATIAHRTGMLREGQAQFMVKEKHFWDSAAGGTARWFLQNGEPGEIAMGDIGYVGWATDYPILDLLGLVDPVIAQLPGGYTHKIGPGFNNRLFDKKSEYFLLISSDPDCRHPSVTGSIAIYRDPRFLQQYKVAGKVPLDGNFAWCIYKRRHDSR